MNSGHVLLRKLKKYSKIFEIYSLEGSYKNKKETNKTGVSLQFSECKTICIVRKQF